MTFGTTKPRDYNQWRLVRSFTGTIADPDVVASQAVSDFAAIGTGAFSVPPVKAEPTSGLAMCMVVVVTATGVPVAPVAITYTATLIEIIGFSGDFNASAEHYNNVFDSPFSTGTLLTRATIAVNTVLPIQGVVGAESKYAFRIEAFTPGASNTGHLFIKGLMGS